MKIASCDLWLNKGHVLEKHDVTPAEVQLLISLHHGNYGGNPIENLHETEEVQRSEKQELMRLLSIYPQKRVKQMYPGASPRMPETFEEVMESPPVETEGDAYLLQSGGTMPSAPPSRGDE